MNIYLHQKANEIGNLEASLQELLNAWSNHAQQGLHLYPELFLGGYPLQDIVLQEQFIQQFHVALNKLKKATETSKRQTLLFGAPEYELSDNGAILNIYNSVYQMDNDGVRPVYRKQLLPNYDIYDEKKYFSPGDQNGFVEIYGHHFCLLICEDMWHSSTHSIDPVKNAFQEFKQTGLEIDAVINLSASPFNISKQQKRINRAKAISDSFHTPFIYINQVGLNDELLFDGQSFIVDQDETLQADMFIEQIIEYPIKKKKHQAIEINLKTPSEIDNTWDELFEAQLSADQKLRTLHQKELQEIVAGITFGLNQYASKTKMKSFLIALSGGIDSALVLALAHLAGKATGMKVEAVYMPSQFNSQLSYDLSKEMCERLGIKLKVLSLKFIHQAIKMAASEGFGEPLEGLADENIQSRLRGNLIYARSNQTGAMVINTSNKSELSVGYSTLYGDSVGAISPLGDLYKSEVFQLASFINTHFGNIIPEGIITRPPSAELREDQKDEDSLPPYERLDLILECMHSYQFSINDIVDLGIERDEVLKVQQLFHRSEFKRYQFCPIIKLKGKSFGFGHRVPILKDITIEIN